MSAIEAQDIMSEDTVGMGTLEAGEGEGLRLVPVAESIRYRKRAQSAEKKIETLTEELAEAKSQAAKMTEELAGLRSAQELTHKLAGSGVVDLEAAVLIAKAKMEGQEEADLDGIIGQLKKDKPYLFAEGNRPSGAKKTSGARERMADSRTIVERAAKKAATTGNRADLQEYLRLRRSFL